jgi:hypothetical protein
MISRMDVIFSGLVTAFFGALFLALAFETWALYTGNHPLTYYIRPAVHTYPGWAFLIAVVIGLMIGHFAWGPARLMNLYRRGRSAG